MSDLSKYTDEELRSELKARNSLKKIERESKDIIDYFNN